MIDQEISPIALGRIGSIVRSEVDAFMDVMKASGFDYLAESADRWRNDPRHAWSARFEFGATSDDNPLWDIYDAFAAKRGDS